MFGNKEKAQPELEFFTIFDTKTSSYRDPMLAVNRHDLIRQLQNMFMEPEQQQKNPLWLNAEDFSIFKVGEYSRKTGVITPCHHENIVNLHDLRAVVQREMAARSERTIN